MDVKCMCVIYLSFASIAVASLSRSDGLHDEKIFRRDSENRCPMRGWKWYRSHCYKFVLGRDQRNFLANRRCGELIKGGYLVAINDREEFDFVTKTIQTVVRSRDHLVSTEWGAETNPGGDRDQWWTGGIRELSYGWNWHVNQTREPVEMSELWWDNEPNNWDNDENYIALDMRGNEWGLNDLNGDLKKRFVCEVDYDGSTRDICSSLGLKRNGDSCYKFVYIYRTPSKASKYCRRRIPGGHLVSINDVKEYNFLVSYLNEVYGGFYDKVQWWTSGVRKAGGSWLWNIEREDKDDEPFESWQLWQDGKPSIDDDNIALDMRTEDQGLNDHNKYESLPFICETHVERLKYDR